MDMDRGVRGYLVNTSRENFWRVAGWYDFDDMIQDGCWMWQRLVIKYPNVTPKHRMALFKTAFTNHIHDLSKKRSRNEFVVNESDLGAEMHEVESLMFSELPDTSLIVSRLPPLLRALIHAIQNDPRARSENYRLHRDDTRETTNERLCRIVGVDPTSIDLLGTLRQYLRGEAPGLTNSAV